MPVASAAGYAPASAADFAPPRLPQSTNSGSTWRIEDYVMDPYGLHAERMGSEEQGLPHKASGKASSSGGDVEKASPHASSAVAVAGNSGPVPRRRRRSPTAASCQVRCALAAGCVGCSLECSWENGRCPGFRAWPASASWSCQRSAGPTTPFACCQVPGCNEDIMGLSRVREHVWHGCVRAPVDAVFPCRSKHPVMLCAERLSSSSCTSLLSRPISAATRSVRATAPCLP